MVKGGDEGLKEPYWVWSSSHYYLYIIIIIIFILHFVSKFFKNCEKR